VGDFLKSAAVLRLEPVLATDAALPLDGGVRHVAVDLADPASAAADIVAAVPGADAVVAIDDAGVEVAARAASALGIRHSLIPSVAATRDKLAMRRLLHSGDVPQPQFSAAEPGALASVAATIGYPVVVKPRGLTASRGVIRFDGELEAETVESRIRRILVDAGRPDDEALLVEEYLPGRELAIEGLLIDGVLEVLAVIDKPDALEGPFFEETMFVTPSRLERDVQARAIDVVQTATQALGLSSGPVHAEVRVSPTGVAKLIEVAARSIGGLCGRALTFGLLGESLETVILRTALGDPVGSPIPGRAASGVLMLPIPASGVLTSVEGIDEVLRVSGIDAVEITIPLGRKVLALPEGDRYLGFIFGSGPTPEAVEEALRAATLVLTVTVDGEALEAVGLTALG